MTLIPGTDPKTPPLVAQVEPAVIHTENVGEGQDAENIPVIPIQSRSENYFFFTSEIEASAADTQL